MKCTRSSLRHFSIPRLLKSKTALGAPVGNLIILVAAVVLSTTVVLFATNVTSSQVQKEKMYIATSHVWYCNSSTSIAAIAICDTGATDLVLSKVDVKGCSANGTEHQTTWFTRKSTEHYPETCRCSYNSTETVPLQRNLAT
jgi:hypothetical protein